jgi:hypothetical protein
MTAWAGTGAMKKLLLQLGPATDVTLKLNTEQWFAVTDGIRQGHCNIKHLHLDAFQNVSFKATEAIKALVSILPAKILN